MTIKILEWMAAVAMAWELMLMMMGMVIGDECKDGTCIGDTKCDDTDIGTAEGLGINYEVIIIR
jgi:hypothetical protein